MNPTGRGGRQKGTGSACCPRHPQPRSKERPHGSKDGPRRQPWGPPLKGAPPNPCEGEPAGRVGIPLEANPEVNNFGNRKGRSLLGLVAVTECQSAALDSTTALPARRAIPESPLLRALRARRPREVNRALFQKKRMSLRPSSAPRRFLSPGGQCQPRIAQLPEHRSFELSAYYTARLQEVAVKAGRIKDRELLV